MVRQQAAGIAAGRNHGAQPAQCKGCLDYSKHSPAVVRSHAAESDVQRRAVRGKESLQGRPSRPVGLFLEEPVAGHDMGGRPVNRSREYSGAESIEAVESGSVHGLPGAGRRKGRKPENVPTPGICDASPGQPHRLLNDAVAQRIVSVSKGNPHGQERRGDCARPAEGLQHAEHAGDPECVGY